MADLRELDESGFPLHIDEMVKSKFASLEPFDYAKEREENNRIADLELYAIMEGMRGAFAYTDEYEAKRWSDELAAQKERLRK